MSEHGAENDAGRCGSFPPAMSAPVRLTIGAQYHVCARDQGHDGLCANREGETWTCPTPPGSTEATRG